MQRIEGMKKLFLGLDFSAEELDVVYKKYIDLSIASLKTSRLVITNTVDEFVGEFL